MIGVEMEFNKGILFIRLNGNLNRNTSNELTEDIIPIVLKYGFKYVVVNLENVNTIDFFGIQALIDLNDVVMRNGGKTTLCSLKNAEVKNIIYEYDNNKFYETKDELSALRVIKI